MDGVSTKIIGFIRPPPDIRVIVDKTAAFVARMGDEVEAKLSAAEASNLKFNFLRSDDPYNAYYRHKVAEGRGVKVEVTPEVVETSVDTSAGAGAGAGAASPDARDAAANNTSLPPPSSLLPIGASVVRGAAPPNPLARALRSFDPSAPPPRDTFRIDAPSLSSSSDIEAARLAAQFTAAGGRSFLAALAARPGAAEEFPFLRPAHPLFAFFTSLVDSYASALRPPPDISARLSALVLRPDSLLERATARLEHIRRAEVAKGDAAAQEAAVVIDWNDFTIVETIDFEDEEEGGGVEIDDAAAKVAAAAAVELDENIGGEQLHVRTDYVPSVRSAAALPHYLHPVTGQPLPLDAATDALRIELLDPKWAADRAKVAARAALPSTLATDEDVAANLRYLATKREDVFGSVAISADGGGPAKREKR